MENAGKLVCYLLHLDNSIEIIKDDDFQLRPDGGQNTLCLQ